MRKAIAELNGKQPGDPNKLAQILVEVVGMANPPLQLALGPDCYYQLDKQLKAQLDDLQKWSRYSLSTDLAE